MQAFLCKLFYLLFSNTIILQFSPIFSVNNVAGHRQIRAKQMKQSDAIEGGRSSRRITCLVKGGVTIPELSIWKKKPNQINMILRKTQIYI